MAQASRKSSTTQAKTSAPQTSPNLSGDGKPKSAEDWAPETVEPGAPEPVMPNPDVDQDTDAGENASVQATGGPETPSDESNVHPEETDQNRAAQGDPTFHGDPVVGLGAFSDTDKRINRDGPTGDEIDPPPSDAIVIEELSEIELDGIEDRNGGMILAKEVVRKLYPMGSLRPTYVTVFPVGVPIPAHKVQAIKNAQEAKKAAESAEDVVFGSVEGHSEFTKPLSQESEGGLAKGSNEADTSGQKSEDAATEEAKN